MFFGAVPIEEARGGIVVHSLRLADGALRKGAMVGEAEIARLRMGGIARIVIARLEPGDIGEDDAARSLVRAVAGEGLRADPPFTGRANLFAEAPGLLRVDAAGVDRLNAVDEAVTLASLPDYRAVEPGELVATVKIIPFAVPGAVLEAANAAARAADRPLLFLVPFRPLRVAVISTLLPGLKPSVIRKTVAVLAQRIAPAKAAIVADLEVAHEGPALAEALAAVLRAGAELVVVFGASAITDRRDVIPAAITAAGGRIAHFGMPVDPGNLLLIGDIGGRPVLGAPGCARSPKENGFDWVLQRLLACLPVTRADIVGMGVGGLLMEIVQRGHPRQPGPEGEGEA